MNNHTAHILGQITASLSLVVGLLGTAPFTGALLLIPFLLPVAALVVWRGAIIAGLLSLLFCVLAIAISPLRIVQLFEWPFVVTWLGLCSVAIIFCAFRSTRKTIRAE
jgi:hypothetical protein